MTLTHVSCTDRVSQREISTFTIVGRKSFWILKKKKRRFTIFEDQDGCFSGKNETSKQEVKFTLKENKIIMSIRDGSTPITQELFLFQKFMKGRSPIRSGSLPRFLSLFTETAKNF
jgi:hypothetical protein